MDLNRTTGPLLSESEAAVEAKRIIKEACRPERQFPTKYRDDSPRPATGDSPPVTQPGRPPMSQRATDHASLVLTYSIGSVPVSGAVSLTLWSLSLVDPTTLAIVAAAPSAFAGTVGIAARMIGRAVRDGASALPSRTVHQHTGPTYVQHNETHTTSNTRGLFSRTRNDVR